MLAGMQTAHQERIIAKMATRLPERIVEEEGGSNEEGPLERGGAGGGGGMADLE